MARRPGRGTVGVITTLKNPSPRLRTLGLVCLGLYVLMVNVQAQGVSEIVQEIDRLQAALDAEETQPTSGNLASLRWRLTAYQRLVQLYTQHRDRTGSSRSRQVVPLMARMVELVQSQVNAAEDYVEEYGQEERLPCDWFFDWENDPERAALLSARRESFEGTPEERALALRENVLRVQILHITIKACVREMATKYPDAWARLRLAKPLVSLDRPPAADDLQRAFTGGTR